MMRGKDPKDMEDIQFLLSTKPISVKTLAEHFHTAMVPDVPEINAAFVEAQPAVLEMAKKLEELRYKQAHHQLQGNLSDNI